VESQDPSGEPEERERIKKKEKVCSYAKGLWRDRGVINE